MAALRDQDQQAASCQGEPVGCYAPPIENGRIRSRGTTQVNLGGYQTLGRVKLAVDVFDTFDANGAEIACFWTSRLEAEPRTGVDDHVYPVEPRQQRVSLRYGF